MRHRKSGRKLGRTASHYRATMANLATSLFEHKKIKTSIAKAKELRSVAERLISFAKKGDLGSRRQVLRTIRNKAVVQVLFDEIAPKFETRNGGYTRIVKLGQRQGDGSEVTFVELVGFEGAKAKKSAKTKAGAKEKASETTKATKTEKTVAEPVESVENDIPEENNEPEEQNKTE